MRLKERNGGLKYKVRSKRRKRELTCYRGQKCGRSRLGMGVDGIKYTELKEHLAKNGEIIKEQLRTRKYKPQPVRRVEIPKPDDDVRTWEHHQ